MIIDTSAVLAIAFHEPSAAWIWQQISKAPRVLMSTINLTEALIIFRDRKPLRKQGSRRLKPDSGMKRLATPALALAKFNSAVS